MIYKKGAIGLPQSLLGLGDRVRPLPIVAIAFVTASTEGALCGTN